MAHHKPSLRPAPACGPARVDYWRDWRAAIAVDVANQLRLIREAGAGPEDLADWAAHYRAWLEGQAEVAITEGLAWAEAWAA